MNRKGHGGSWPFSPKVAAHSVPWEQVRSCSRHEVGKDVERVFKNSSLEPNAASYNNASWYTDADGFLEY